MAHPYKMLTGMAHDSYNQAIKSLETLELSLMASSKSENEKQTSETATDDNDPAEKAPMTLNKILEVLHANEVTWLKAWIKAKYSNFNLITMVNNAELNMQSVRQMYHRSQTQLATAHSKIQELRKQLKDQKMKLTDTLAERKIVTDQLNKCLAENEILKKMQVNSASPHDYDYWNEDKPASKRMRFDCDIREKNCLFDSDHFAKKDNEDEVVGDNDGVDNKEKVVGTETDNDQA